MNKKIWDKIIPLVKISLLTIVAPLMVFAILAIYNKIEIIYCLYGMTIILIISVMLFKPYIDDLYNLTEYVRRLANDDKAKLPRLKYLKNIEHLTNAINNLNTSWQKKELELESRILENRIIFDTLPDVLLMLDSNYNVTRANSEALRIFGNNIINQKIENVIESEMLLNHIKWVMLDKKLKSVEVFLENLQKYYMIKIAKFPSYDTGSIAIILIVTDISDAKRTEQMFIDFVANASHEIKTPLASIKGFVEIIQTTAQDDKEAQERFLKIIAEQAERLNLLVNELLSLSKLEMNNNLLPDVKLDVKEIINIVYNDLKYMQDEKNIIFHFQYPSELPYVIGEKAQLIQVFTNLFSNAMKYGNSNSEIKVVTEIAIEPTEFVTDIKKWIKIKVIDQGEGIEKEHISRLTERFYRVDNSRIRNNKVGGTGLGLAIVKQILNKHGGELVIESTVGVGSVFTVYLPIRDKIN